MNDTTENIENTDAGNTPAADTAAAAKTDSNPAATGEGEGQGEAGNPADETKAKDEGEGADDTKADDKDAEPKGAPEQYEAFTLPEGFQLEGDRLEMAHEFAKANNWTQEQAQEGVNTYLKFREAERQMERGAWAVAAEDEFGKDFANITGGAQRALVMLESERPGITERLDATSLGNHPDVLWVMNELGQHLKPKPIKGMNSDAPAAGKRDLASRFYPEM